jgi:hypothetical protein
MSIGRTERLRRSETVFMPGASELDGLFEMGTIQAFGFL